MTNESSSPLLMLAAVDLGDHGVRVFRAASAVAVRMQAELVLLHVLEVPPDIPPAAHMASDDMDLRLRAGALAALRTLMKEAPNVRFRPPIVVEGDPFRRILDVAHDVDVDLVVVGGHRRHGLERVLGSVASNVVNHADRDVLVVRDTPEATRE
jgi:universal stress protein A